MPARSQPVTLTDVARLAGVSVGTASRALNDRTEVKPETRTRVRDAAEKLAFFPNALARGLLNGRSKTVGLLTGDVEGRFSIPVLIGAEDAFGVGDVSVFMCDGRGDPERERLHLRSLLSHRVDGLIVVGDRADLRPSLGRGLGVPVVYAFAASSDPSDMSVISDDLMGGQLAAEHLLSTGRRKIVYISGNPSFGASHVRAQGAQQALTTAGLRFATPPVFGSWHDSWGREAARSLVESGLDFDGVLCANDSIARGLQEELIKIGRSVPDDVAVVGYDNWVVISGFASPEITSVDMDLPTLGRRAAERLSAAIDGKDDGGTELVGCRLEVRESSRMPMRS